VRDRQRQKETDRERVRTCPSTTSHHGDVVTSGCSRRVSRVTRAPSAEEGRSLRKGPEDLGVERCSVLQCVTVCCGVLQCKCVAVCCSVLQCVAVRCSVLQCVGKDPEDLGE